MQAGTQILLDIHHTVLLPQEYANYCSVSRNYEADMWHYRNIKCSSGLTLQTCSLISLADTCTVLIIVLFSQRDNAFTQCSILRTFVHNETCLRLSCGHIYCTLNSKLCILQRIWQKTICILTFSKISVFENHDNSKEKVNCSFN
jgi:hypothetical protein